jgi:alkanesulfonate monooxygenase SsuD/methylene tetrahydromethanopterin reductase-like flavin-dependent oxidoreductase (luciferase family)
MRRAGVERHEAAAGYQHTRGVMTGVDFAFWDAVSFATPGRNPTDVFEQHIALAQRVEALGWNSYFIIEHQNTPTGISAPSVYLTAVARATSRLRIGAMMWQLPFYHPLRLAQEVATLDHLSRGRVEFGAGFGVHEHEFLRWNVDYYQRAAMGKEVLDIVKMAWTRPEVTFQGDFFHFDEALPQPRPYQQPYPPIWLAVHSDPTIEYAARNNYHVAQNLDTDHDIARKFDLYRRVWRESGHPQPMPRTFLQRAVHVAETDAKAHEEARQYLATGEGRFRGGPIAETRVGWGSHPRGMGRDSDLPDNKTRGLTMARAAESYEFNINNGLALVGSPETVINQLQAGRQRIGYDVFCTNHQIGRMPPQLVDNSIRLFGEEVIPAFRGVLVGG